MDCNICFRKYNAESLTPRMLPSCGHTLCEDCGVKLLKNGQLACPFDRTVSNLVNGSIQNLPKNFAILELLESVPAPSPAPAAPPVPPEPEDSEDDCILLEEYLYNLQLEAPEQAVGEREQGHVEPDSHNDDALDDDIDPVFLQEMFGNQAPPIPEPELEDSEDDEISVEEYMFNLGLDENDDGNEEESENSDDDDGSSDEERK